jgi:hypothetical protein
MNGQSFYHFLNVFINMNDLVILTACSYVIVFNELQKLLLKKFLASNAIVFQMEKVYFSSLKKYCKSVIFIPMFHLVQINPLTI